MKSMKLRKVLGVTLAATIAAAALAGCGGSGDSKTAATEAKGTEAKGTEAKGTEEVQETTADTAANDTEAGSSEAAKSDEAKEGVTITVAASSNWIKDIDKELAAKYEEESGNTIQWQASPDDQYTNVLNSKFAVGEGPDIYLTQSGAGIEEYQPAEHALDLSGEEWVSRYRDWAKEGTTYDGKIVQCLTWSADGWAMLYNPDIFEKAGIKEAPKTFDSFMEACEAIKNIGITPIYEPGAAQWHQATWLDTISAQAEEAKPGLRDSLNKNTAKFAEQEGLLKGLEQMKQIEEAGYFGEEFMSNTWESSVDKMITGEYAMILVYTTFQNEIMAKDPSTNADKWEMFSVPLNDNTVFAQSSGGVGRSINKDSKVIDAAKDYFNFLTRKENLETYYAARQDLGQCSFTDIEGNVSNGYKTVVDNGTGVGQNFETGVTNWNSTEIGIQVQNMYLGGTAMEVLEGIDAMREPLFEK